MIRAMPGSRPPVPAVAGTSPVISTLPPPPASESDSASSIRTVGSLRNVRASIPEELLTTLGETPRAKSPRQVVPAELLTTHRATPEAIRRSSPTFGIVPVLLPDQIEVFFDGACPLCSREVKFIHARDKKRCIVFTDIAAAEFDARARGLSREALMARLHARLPDERLVDGIEVFRRMYELIGFRALVAVSRWPGVRQVLDFVYRRFAAQRLRLTGRCTHESCELPSRHHH